MISCNKNGAVANMPITTDSVSHAITLYTTKDRLVYKSEDFSGRSEPLTFLFLLSAEDPLPDDEYKEVLERSQIKKNIVSLIKNIDKFKDTKPAQISEFKSWFEFENKKQIRALYFLTDSGDRYFLVKIYEEQ